MNTNLILILFICFVSNIALGSQFTEETLRECKTREKHNFCEKFSSIVQEVESCQQLPDLPKLRYIAYTYIVSLDFAWNKHQNDLATMFYNCETIKSLEEIKIDITKKLSDIYNRIVSTSAEETKADIRAELEIPSSYIENYNKEKTVTVPEITAEITHGGDLFFIINFLIGIKQGYQLERSKVPGIQVHPRFKYKDEDEDIIQEEPGAENDERIKDYAHNMTSHLSYPALLKASINTEHLDSADNLYEAGLRYTNRSYLKNIQIIPLKRLRTWDRRITDKSLNTHTKQFIISYLDDVLSKLKQDNDYHQELMRTFQHLKSEIMSDTNNNFVP